MLENLKNDKYSQATIEVFLEVRPLPVQGFYVCVNVQRGRSIEAQACRAWIMNFFARGCRHYVRVTNYIQAV